MRLKAIVGSILAAAAVGGAVEPMAVVPALTWAVIAFLPKEGDAARAYPTLEGLTAANEFVFATVPLSGEGPGGTRVRATGFFYQINDDLYLITCRHAVLDEGTKVKPTALTLELHADAADLTRSDDYVVKLYDKGKNRRWLEHPRGAEVDLVAIPLERGDIFPRFQVRPLGPANLPPAECYLGMGAAVTVLGYPLGFYDKTNNLPIARAGFVASAYPVPFGGDPYFYLDAHSHRGMSGGPVLARFAVGPAAPTVFLLGINAGQVDTPGRDPKVDEPLGLERVWYSYLIPEILGTVKNGRPAVE